MLRTGTEKLAFRAAFVIFSALAAAVVTAGLATAQQPGGDLQAQLAAGEFAPAVAAAENAGNPQQRDAALAQVAAAQAQAGAPAAAVKTVAKVGNDRLRADILAAAGIGAGGVGAGGAGAAGQDPNNPNGANFTQLEDLIKNTVATKTWLDNGGTGTIGDFPTGVWVDPTGVLRRMKEARGGSLAALRAGSQQRSEPANEYPDDARRNSPLRMVSLVQLEKQIEMNAALGQAPSEAMRYLAGLRRIQYVFVYPETGDLVIAGPAGDWTAGPEGHVVAPDSGSPVLRLDDLVVVFRHMLKDSNAYFGCKIDPRREALARVQQFQARHKGPIPAGAEARREWCEEFRAAVGKQDISMLGGLDPETRAARTLVEADYRMKLVGMGLEPGVPGLTSYMSLIKSPPRSIDVLRWWFTLDYDAIQTSQDRLAFEIRGQGVKVQSENEHLTAQGERVHTGESEPLNRQFAESFTKHFDEMCVKYPIYADLRNLCDLALVASLVREEGLADKADWHMACFGNPQSFAVEKCAVPKETETVVNYRVLREGLFVAQVNGGVVVQPADLVAHKAIQVESYPHLNDTRPHSAAKPHNDRWWWD